jgi:hypothetical protein
MPPPGSCDRGERSHGGHDSLGLTNTYAEVPSSDSGRSHRSRSNSAAGSSAGLVIRVWAGQGSVTGRPAAMSVASWRRVAAGRRTPRGLSELRSSC